jgi:hypothetical protein
MMGSANRDLVGKPKGERPTERLRRRWKDNIKIALAKIWREFYCADKVPW